MKRLNSKVAASFLGKLGGEMNASTLGFFKTFLLDQKSSILNKTSEFRTEQFSEKIHIAEEAELASHDLSNSLSIHLHERDRSQLLLIERALCKIADGSYGLCESCDGGIGENRLKARPFATLCIECMEDQEDSRRHH